MAKLVKDLSGVELDYWAAKANEAHLPGVVFGGVGDRVRVDGAFCVPSTNWAQGGPIIERERISLGYHADGVRSVAVIDDRVSWNTRYHGFGETPLIAAMRAFVVSKFGESVDA